MSNRMIAWLSIIGVILGIAVSITLTETLLSPLIEMAEWFPENGILGIFLWLILYVILALLVAPASFHKFVSGVLFGFWMGWIVAFVGAILGAILPFWITRKYLHHVVEKKTENSPVIMGIQKSVKENGFKCVFLTRISLVIPYPFLNYGYGVTDVKWKDYFLGSSGMIVPGLLYAYWGSKSSDIAGAIEGSRDWTYWASLSLSLLLTIWIIYYLRNLTMSNIDLMGSE